MANAYDRFRGLSDVEILGHPFVGGPVEILGDPIQKLADAQEQNRMIQYTEQGYSKADRVFLGVGAGATGPTPLLPGAVVTVAAQVNAPFKILRMTHPSDQCPDVFIERMNIGPTLLVDGTMIPLAIFSEVSTNNQISFPTLETSQSIIITLRNTSAVDTRQIAFACWGIRLLK